MRNAGLDEAQAGIKILGRNINNLRYADATNFVAESKEQKSLLMKVKEESEKVVLKLNIQKTKIMALGPITSWQIDGEIMETMTDWSQIRKGVHEAVNCHSAYLTYIQSTSWKTLGWSKHKLESRFWGEISITLDMQMTPSLWQKVKKN